MEQKSGDLEYEAEFQAALDATLPKDLKDMYFQYISEREGKKVYQTEWGFAKYSYDLNLGIVYIEDIFVVPEKRMTKEASKIADAIVQTAQGLGCTKLLGSVSPSKRGAHSSLVGLLVNYGMRLHKAEADIIYLVKDI